MTAKRPKVDVSHPRLHFKSGDLLRLREQAQNSHARYAALLYKWVDDHAHWEPPTVESFESLETKEVVLEEAGAFLTNAALAYILSQEKRYLNLAKTWALKMCDVPSETPDNYGFGPYVAGLARAYDWLYAHFSTSEQIQLQNHIAKIARGLYLGSFPNSATSQWWAECHLHHDHWIPTGGYGEAALALVGDVDDAEAWALRARQEFDTSFSWLGDDGAWLEGPADLCYALAPLLWFYGAWHTATGEDLHHVPWLEQTATYRLYHWLPDDTYVYTNDSFRSGRYNTSGSAACHLLRRLASVFNNPQAQWLAARDELFDLKPGPKGVPQAAYEGISVVGQWQEFLEPQALCAAWNFLWFDPTVKAEAPDNLPLARHFENQGVGVTRSSWGEDATVLTFSCAPLAGHRAADRMRAGETRPDSSFYHAHTDYNAFTLFTEGRYALVPPGYARRDSRFQNTISVDGAQLIPNPERQPKVLAFAHREAFTYFLGDASDVFADHLQVRRYRRHLVFLPPDRLVVYDELERNPTAARFFSRFEWALHSDPNLYQVATSGSRASWQREGAADLIMQVLTPEAFAWDQSRYTSKRSEALLEGLRVSVPEWYGSTIHALCVFNLAGESQPAEPISARGGEVFKLPGAENQVIAFKHTEAEKAHEPLLSYCYGEPHRLLVFGLPGSPASVDVYRDADTLEIRTLGEVQVEPGGWLEHFVEGRS